jgi:hypothetical protein
MGENVDLWNNSWLKETLYKDTPFASIVNGEILSKVTPVITFRETRAYNECMYEDTNVTQAN